jgi:hypothetical protein
MSFRPLFLCLLLSPALAKAQSVTNAPAGPVETAPVKFQDIRVTSAAPSAGAAAWGKILLDFEVSETWLDGLQFAVKALVGDGTSEKPFSVLTGNVRYFNIPQGKNSAVLYVSPNTMKRFGSLAAVQAELYFRDRVVGSKSWLGAKGPKTPDNWGNQFQQKAGALLPISATPWVSVEYDKYPDILLGR